VTDQQSAESSTTTNVEFVFDSAFSQHFGDADTENPFARRAR
jgi:hypothetical protein